MDAAKEKGSTKFSGLEIQQILGKPEMVARLKTRQDPMRILQYYQGKLMGSGLLRVS